MCKFWSCIVDFEGDVYYNPLSDNHSEFKLPDKYKDNTADKKELQFAKVEISPVDDDVFSDPKLWKFIIDEERKPEWWSKFHEKQARKELKNFLKSAIIIGKNIDIIENGRFWIKDCNTIANNAIVVCFGSSRVVARGSSRVEARGSSSIVAWESSSVVAWDSSNIKLIKDNSYAIIRGDKTKILVADKDNFILENFEGKA